MGHETYPILSLLAAAVFADKKVYACELTMFVQSAKRLQTARCLDPKLSEAGILMWYENNKARIQNSLSHPHFESWFYGLLDHLAGIPEKRLIVEILEDIAACDGEVHVSETALIKLVEKHWRMAA